MLADILEDQDTDSLKYWCWRAAVSRLPAMRNLAQTIKKHWDGVTAFMKTRITNGLVEAINGLLQLAKRAARGIKSFRNFRTIAYLKAANRNLPLPSPLPT